MRGSGVPDVYLDNVGKSIVSHGGKRSGDVSKPDRLAWTNLVDRKAEYGKSRAKALEACGRGYAVYGHAGEDEGRVVKHLGCKQPFCPDCGPKMEDRRASEAWDHLEGYDAWYWSITATMPRGWYAKAAEPDDLTGKEGKRWENWDGKMARAMHRAFERVVNGRWGCVYSQHGFSSAEPWKFHPHVNLVGPRRYITKAGTLGICGWFDLPKLKQAYAEELRKAFGTFPMEIGTADGLPVIYVALRTASRVKRHTLPYITRGPIDWREFGGFREGGRKVVYGGVAKRRDGSSVVPRREVPTRTFAGVFRMYERGRHRVRYLGYLHARVRVKVAALFGVKEVVRHVWTCATCGRPMELLEVHRDGWDWVRGESWGGDQDDDQRYERDKRRAERIAGSPASEEPPGWV